MPNKFIIIMGVSGSGKTTIGELLSLKTGWPFYDADGFHSKENVAKMKAGIPLTDDDRWPWLHSINEFAKEKTKNHSIILACSALKEIYRKELSKSIETNCQWIFLKGNYEQIWQRMQQRQHYMPSSLLRSQFDILEEPNNVLLVDITMSPEKIVEYIVASIK